MKFGCQHRPSKKPIAFNLVFMTILVIFCFYRRCRYIIVMNSKYDNKDVEMPEKQNEAPSVYLVVKATNSKMRSFFIYFIFNYSFYETIWWSKIFKFHNRNILNSMLLIVKSDDANITFSSTIFHNQSTIVGMFIAIFFLFLYFFLYNKNSATKRMK